MPIDSRIALGVDPVKVPTVMDLRAQAAQVRNLEAQEPLQQQQAQINAQRLRGGEMELIAEEQKIAAAKRKEQGFGVLSKLAAQYGDDHKAIAEGLNQAGYADLGLDYLSDTAKIRKEVIDADLKQVQTSKERTELVANVAASVNSQESLQRAVGQLLMAGIPAEVVGPWLAKPWNEQTKAELQQIALSATSAKDQAELLIKQAAEARAAEDAANTRPGKDGLTPYQRASLSQGAETADTRNYKAAVAAGFKGDFNEFLNVDANRKRPVTNVTTNVNTPQQTFSNESSLRKEFEDQPAVKSFRVVSEQVERAKQAFDEIKTSGGSLNAADQVLITVLNKVLDPASVVRESEYARVALGQGWQSRFEGFIDKVKRGGAGISDEERKSVYNMIQKLGKASEANYRPVEKQFRDLAGSYQGLSPDRVVRTAPAPAATGGGVPKVGDTFGNGEKIVNVRQVK